MQSGWNSAGVSEKRCRVLGRSKTDRGVWRTDGGAQEYLRSGVECCEVADGRESVGGCEKGGARRDLLDPVLGECTEGHYFE